LSREGDRGKYNLVFNLGMGEITVILLLALIFLGPKKLPDLAAGLGKIIKEIRKATSDVKNEIALDDSFRKPFEELRDAVTLHPEELKRRDLLHKAIAEAQRRDEEAARAAAESGGGEAPPAAEVPPDGLVSPVKIMGVSHPDLGEGSFAGNGAAGVPVGANGTHADAVGPGTAGTANDTIVQPAPPRGATLDDIPTPAPAPVKPATTPTAAPAARAPLGTVPRPAKASPAPAAGGDPSNVTQILREEDLLPGPTASGPPLPPPLPGVVRRPAPPAPGSLFGSVPPADKKKP
jgi:Sec-independent protein translocase protein TatA